MGFFSQPVRILFCKAQQHALFDAPITVQGHTRASTGAFVAPYISRRKKRLEIPRAGDLFGTTAPHPARTHAAGTARPELTLQPSTPAPPTLANTGGTSGGSGSGSGSGNGNGNGNGGEPPDNDRPASVEENIQRGLTAMKQIVAHHHDVPHAMFRSEMGWIDFVWGDEGAPPKASGKRPGANGIAHILEARQRKDGHTVEDAVAFLAEIVQTLARGTVTTSRYSNQQRGTAGTKAVVQHNGVEAILLRDDGATAWLLTGYEKEKTSSGVRGKGGGNPTATHAGPTPPRPGVGAEEDPSIPKTPPPAKEAPASKQPWAMTKKEFGYGDTNDWPLNISSKGKVYGEAARTVWRAENPDRPGPVGYYRTQEAAQKWVDKTHRRLVKQALKEGQPVPAAVLADYPDLKAQFHKAWPLPLGARILFVKAEVRGHIRRLASGKIVTVRPYHNRRSKKADDPHLEPSPDWQQDVQRQMAAVVARYTLPDGAKAPGWLKAPNGEPTKLNERQWIQVRTENFGSLASCGIIKYN